MNSTNGTSLKQTIQQFKKSSAQRNNRYLWDEILLFYRKEIASLQNEDILSLIKIGLKILKKQMLGKIKKLNKKNKNESNNRQVIKFNYEVVENIFSSYNRVLSACLNEFQPSFFNMLFRKQININLSKYINFQKNNKKQIIFEPTQLRKQAKTKESEQKIERETKNYFKCILQLAINKLKIFFLNGEVQNFLKNIQVVDKIFNNICSTSNKFIFQALKLQILKLNIVQYFKDENIVQIKYKYPFSIIYQIWKNKNKWEYSKLKYVFNLLITYTILVLKNILYVKFSSSHNYLVQINILLLEIILIHKELVSNHNLQKNNKNIAFIVTISSKIQQYIVPKIQLIDIINKFFKVQKLLGEFKELKVSYNNVKQQQNTAQWQEKKINEKNQKKISENGNKKIIVKLQKKTSLRFEKDNIVDLVFEKLGFQNYSFSTINTEDDYGITSNIKIIDESQYEQLHPFEKKRRQNLKFSATETKISLVTKPKYQAKELQNEESSQIEGINSGEPYLPYKEVVQNLKRLEQETNRIKSYSNSSVQTLKIKKNSFYNLDEKNKIIEPQKSNVVNAINNFNEKMNNMKNIIKLQEKKKKKLKIQKSQGLPKIKALQKTEQMNIEKQGIQLSQKYEKLSRMILFSNAGRDKEDITKEKY